MKPRRFFHVIPIIALMFSLLGSVAKVISVRADLPSGLDAADWKQIQVLLTPTQQAYLKASNTEEFDQFGWSIATFGDTVVVGVPYEDSDATGVNGNEADNSAFLSGAVYVFTRSSGGWSQQAYLKASNTGIGDAFGHSVAISGDTIVVGATGEKSNATGVNGNQADNSADRSGAAYVFTRSGEVWSQQAYLKASNTGAIDYFGISVAISGDTIVVGAYTEDSNATGVNGNQADNSAPDSGAAYVFTRSGSNWSQQAYLKASNTNFNDSFGYSVAISGDTVVVGAYSEGSNATGVNGDQANNSASASGAAYIYTRSGSVWSQQAYLKASNAETNEWFGYSVAISGDTVVVGAYQENSNATGVNGNQADNSAAASGATYVFTRSGATWSQQAYLKASNTGVNDNFGSRVDISGDTIVVGAPYEDSNAIGMNGNGADNSADRSGAAYIFTRNGMTWSQLAYLKASNTGTRDFFGYSLAISDDTIIVGAPNEQSYATGVNGNQADNSASYAGAAYVFQLSTTPQSPTFADVPLDYWAWRYIESLYNSGITGGCGNGNYCPTSPVTRTQMAVFLLKGIHGASYAPPTVNGSTGFNDVAIDYWAAAWIKQLAAEGITGGCGNSNYCPENTVTRDQMAVFLLKAKYGSSYAPPAVNGSTGFTDVPADYWAAAWIKQLAAESITGGCGGGLYCPSNPVTRDQMAVFLQKTFNLPLP